MRSHFLRAASPKGGGGGGGWEPTDLGADLAFWYDGSDVSSFGVTSGEVDTWSDKSGNSWTLTTKSGTPKPRFLSGLGLSTVNADQTTRGNSACMEMPADVNIGSWFASCNIGSGTYPISSLGTAYHQLISRATSGPPYSGGYGDRVGRIFDSRYSGGLSTNAIIYYNGVETLHSGAYTDALWTTDASIIAVQRSNGGGTYPTGRILSEQRYPADSTFLGNVYDLIGLTREATSTERELIEGYFAWRTGAPTELLTKLPSGHPYKSSPP